MRIGEFFVALGVDVENKDSKKLNDVIKGMANLDVKSIAAAAGLGTAFLALKKITEQAIKTGHALRNFSIQTGLSTENLQKWSFFAEQMGATAADVESTVKAISLATAQIKLGQGNLKPFQMLGIDPNQDAFDILEQVAQKIKNLDPAMTRLITQQMGISDGMLNILKASDDVRADIEKQFFMREKEIEQLNDLRMVWVRLRQGIFFFLNMVGIHLSPVFKNVGKFVGELTVYLAGLVRGFDNLKLIIIGMAIIFAPMNTAIAAIILLIDDLYVSLHGGESAFKPTFDKMAQGWIKIERWIWKANKALKTFKDNLLFKNLPSMSHILSGAIPRFNLGGGGGGKSETRVEINVNGTDYPALVASKVRDALQSIFKSTSYQTPGDAL